MSIQVQPYNFQSVQYHPVISDIVTVSRCSICSAYYPYEEYGSGDELINYKDYGVCSETGDVIHQTQSKPEDCPRSGSLQIIAVKY
jgi:hypothetical protein